MFTQWCTDQHFDHNLRLCIGLGSASEVTTLWRCTNLFIIITIIIFYTPGSKDPRGLKLQKLKSKCRMVRGPTGQLAECRAKAQS